MQPQLFETAPIIPIPKGIEEIAPGVFRNHDSGTTWSLRRRPICNVMHQRNGQVYFCNHRKGHRGKHKNTSHATGSWVRTRWTEAECFEMSAAAQPQRKSVGCDPDAPRRELPLASKQSIRRKSLVRRVTKKAPLFAEQLIETAHRTQPEYFGTADVSG